MIVDEQFGSRFGTAVTAGTAPDVVALDLITVPAFVAAHELTDITKSAHGLSFFNELSPAPIRLVTYRDKQYGVPFSDRRLWTEHLSQPNAQVESHSTFFSRQ